MQQVKQTQSWSSTEADAIREKQLKQMQ